MATDTIQYFSDIYQKQAAADGSLEGFRRRQLDNFSKWGIPGPRHEEWKYARVAQLFTDKLSYLANRPELQAADIDPYRFPGAEAATELVFVNGQYHPGLSTLRHAAEMLHVDTLGSAAIGAYAQWIEANIGHSAQYHPDGVHALNGAFAGQGLFLEVEKNAVLEAPVYIYHLVDSRSGFTFAQPRILVHVQSGAQLQIAEQYINLGGQDSFTNEVIEIVAEAASVVDYYKIQNEGPLSNHVGTTHIRQAGKCLTNAVTITLGGGMVRNNLNMIMESANGESHMYGLSLLDGKTLADNHTIVDNVQPHCFSNELYKAIMDGESTGIFNGKIFVRKDAQKTNAYQSNKNILLGEKATANTKPQLEIFADDVKCSHGCTVGRLDEEALFYLRARGIGEKSAKALLLHAFAVDVLEHIKHEQLRTHVDRLISERLDFNF
jgi:Fe-S cluster assembly protein SufD